MPQPIKTNIVDWGSFRKSIPEQAGDGHVVFEPVALGVSALRVTWSDNRQDNLDFGGEDVDIYFVRARDAHRAAVGPVMRHEWAPTPEEYWHKIRKPQEKANAAD